mmetsp:Transcript_31589/g.48287  ORF Transcript_31589/g.48287 Transcript_31589/m.48287 type:complete len:172 (+) Transcript_31589:1193-1708(+)
MRKNKKLAQNIEISHDARSIYIKEDEYVFRNFFGQAAFTEGIHYWEIVADSRTEHELKVGVSKINDMEQSEEWQSRFSEVSKKTIEMQRHSEPTKPSVNLSKRYNSQSNLGSDLQMSFSDVPSGWAFFGIGQVRHNSNMHGRKYGKSFKRQGILGVYLNMNKGILSFSLDG